MIKTLINIISSPTEAFISIKEKPTVLLPLLLILIFAASMQYGYFNAVDPEFLIDQTVEQAAALTNQPESQIRESLADIDSDSIMIQSIISVIIIVPLIMAFYAGYLSLISKFTYDEIRFKQWYSLNCWTGILSIFSAIAGWVVILTNSDGMIAQMEIIPLSLNNLIFQTTGPFQTMLSQLHVIQIWTLGLLSMGYANWTGKSLGKSVAIVVAPYVVIYGIWSIIILT
jgi:hypothetical protein